MALEWTETINGVIYFIDYDEGVCDVGAITDKSMIEVVILNVLNITATDPTFSNFSGEYKVTNISRDFALDCAVEIITLPATITSFDGDCFSSAASLKTIYYQGTEAQWNSIEGVETAGIAESVTVHFKPSAATALMLLADEVRELSGTTTFKSIDVMTSDIDEANAEIFRQAELLAQIIAVLESKTGGEPIEERLEGDGQEFYTTAPSTLSFRSTAPLNELQDVQINGQTVDPSNYELEEGSTIVKLKHDYLSTLNVGKYELSVVSDSKTVKGDFTVKAPELNESGFYYSQVYYGGEVSLGDNFNGELAFFITESNECFLINYSSGDCSSVTMTQEENLYTIYLYDDVYIKGYFTEGGVFKGTESFASGGKWAPDYIGEGVDFTLFSGDHRAASDGSMLYIKDPSAEGYRVAKCFSTAEKIDNIKTNIVNLPVTRINSSCFNGCDHLKELVIPDFMSDIYSNTILGADNIEKITVPYIPPSFGGDTNVLSFLGNTSNSIHTFILTEGETRIIDKAFCETALTNITLPSTLVHIGWHAFSSSPALTNIVFNGTTEQWNAIEKVPDWNYDIPATYVQCSDGQVAL